MYIIFNTEFNPILLPSELLFFKKSYWWHHSRTSIEWKKNFHWNRNVAEKLQHHMNSTQWKEYCHLLFENNFLTPNQLTNNVSKNFFLMTNCVHIYWRNFFLNTHIPITHTLTHRREEHFFTNSVAFFWYFLQKFM